MGPKPTSNVSVSLNDLKTLLAEQSREIVFSLTNQIKELKEVIEIQANKIKTLETRFIEQEIKIAQIDNNSRKEYAILHGVPDDNHGSLNTIIKKLDLKIDHDYQPIRLGIKKDTIIRPVKIKFNNEKTKINSIQSAITKMNASPDSFKNIYINYDQNYLFRSENKRLRNIRKELKAKYPNKIVRLIKGQVLLDNTVFDTFDLSKQINFDNIGT